MSDVKKLAERYLKKSKGYNFAPEIQKYILDIFEAGFEAGKKDCSHPGCCCVCGHQGLCPEDGPTAGLSDAITD